MILHTAPLVETIETLRSGALDLHAFIDQTCDRIDQIDGHLQAFLPEPERCTRLHAEAAAIAHRNPDPANRLSQASITHPVRSS